LTSPTVLRTGTSKYINSTSAVITTIVGIASEAQQQFMQSSTKWQHRMYYTPLQQFLTWKLWTI